MTTLTQSAVAPNYNPLAVTIASAEGAWVTDVDGRRYLDCLAGYSALNFGHGHPVLLDAARRQLDRVTLTSRAFGHDQLAPFCDELAALARQADPAMDMVLPMNTGAEAVETAVKVSRKWGYDVKGVAPGAATIVVADGNFHGRTTTIVSFSTDPVARAGFGPFTPGFRVVPYGDAAALAAAVDETTVAVLLEPIQGEGGVVIPPAGYLAAARGICDRAGALLVLDEIQAGLGRTGTTFACLPGPVEVEGVRPDVLVLGKALGGGIVPVSAVVSRHDVLGVMTAGSHGSTFGGNPLAADAGRVGRAPAQQGRVQVARVGRAAAVLVGHVQLDGLAGGDDGAVAGAPATSWGRPHARRCPRRCPAGFRRPACRRCHHRRRRPTAAGSGRWRPGREWAASCGDACRAM